MAQRNDFLFPLEQELCFASVPVMAEIELFYNLRREETYWAGNVSFTLLSLVLGVCKLN
jgi:hypothetical protein